MKYAIPKASFNDVMQKSKSLLVGDLLFYYQNTTISQIGFIVSRKMGRANLRNLFKRRCRTLFYSYQTEGISQYKIIIKPVKKLENHYSWEELQVTFKKFLSKLLR